MLLFILNGHTLELNSKNSLVPQHNKHKEPQVNSAQDAPDDGTEIEPPYFVTAPE